MKSLIRSLVVPGILFTCFTCGFAQDGFNRNVREKAVKGGVATLYGLDPLSQSFCFSDPGEGHVFQQHAVRNRCSDINYGSYHAEHFSVGIEGGRLGNLVDLGTADDLKKEYGYEETVGGGQGFASIHLEDGNVVILKDRRAQLMQALKESATVFGQPAKPGEAPVKLGHIYLARITDNHDSSFQLVVKLLVIAYVPGESVTLRWQTL
jgi:hypothetical protein